MTAFSLLSPDQLVEATTAAESAFASFRSLPPQPRATLLDRVADALEADSEEIVERAAEETHLPRGRLSGELARTTGQLRFFAEVVRQGDHHGVRIDPALPDRAPLPRPDVRQRTVPVGPVAVFGASNFPLAFSVTGGDTASALAAGCPVVVKAHNAHLGTTEVVGRAVAGAVAAAGLPPGVFSVVQGPGDEIGRALVSDPRVAAVGFTGSRAGGLALAEVAARRPVPIPVYAEMSSVNPVFLLEGALEDDVESLATAYLGSLTGSSGQLCTAPGLLFVPRGPAGDAFLVAVERLVSAQPGQAMLTPGIAGAWRSGVEAWSTQDGVSLVGAGRRGPSEDAPPPSVYAADVTTFLDNRVLHEEVFGAAGLVVRYDRDDDLLAAVDRLEGQLTATLHLAGPDHALAAPLLEALELKVGRIVVNGWPTGVDVGHAMVHGGPYPATTAPWTTSVGSRAIERWLRPVAYQGVPDALLPEPLRDGNPWRLTRRVDGRVEPAR